jgi:hypothetical protein
MKQEELFQYIDEERKKQGLRQEDLRDLAQTAAVYSIKEVVAGRASTTGIKYIIQILDVLGLQLTVEDKDADWGLDMRLRRMPKKLFTAQRIESREIIRKEGFYARVDLFEKPEDCLKFVPTPCDIYEIWPHRLIRKHFDVIDHPFGTMYSYNDWISPDYIEDRVTHRK